MIAVFLAPFYCLLCAYIFLRGIRWLGACHGFFARRRVQAAIVAVYVFFAVSILLAFWLPQTQLRRAMKLVSNYWLGVILYLLLTVAAADLLHFICRHIRCLRRSALFSQKGHEAVGAVCLICTLLLTASGVASARELQTTKYEITVEKACGARTALNVVLLADLHLGYNTDNGQVRRMVQKINALQPDIVFVAGDIFDNEYEAIQNPDELAGVLRGIRSQYGVYACYGNHDIQEPILAGFTFRQNGAPKVSSPKMDAFLRKASVHLLRDTAVLIDDSFYVYGRPDCERPGRGIRVRKTPEQMADGMELSKPLIVLDHEPRQLQALADAGVDVDLCGHTHDGQLFPFNLLTALKWENSCGYLKKGAMHNIVTSGVGVFGPNMRVGTKSEICAITLNFSPVS